uniref:Uncharacterized protein n=1 Tax=Morchella brunnea TaxID=1174671 RepID=A0A8K1MHA4_9PEZI|nr:hypothetical protein LK370_mgp024 [Morchella brunnea]UBU98460.1 hypothetical protein [Morchella brunnea]
MFWVAVRDGPLYIPPSIFYRHSPPIYFLMEINGREGSDRMGEGFPGARPRFPFRVRARPPSGAPEEKGGGVRAARGLRSEGAPLALNLRILHSSLCTFEYSGDKYPTLRVAHYYNTFLSLIFFMLMRSPSWAKKITSWGPPPPLRGPHEGCSGERKGGPFSFFIVGRAPPSSLAGALFVRAGKKNKKPLSIKIERG